MGSSTTVQWYGKGDIIRTDVVNSNLTCLKYFWVYLLLSCWHLFSLHPPLLPFPFVVSASSLIGLTRKSDGIQAYQEMIGVLQWAVKLGRVDMLLEVALMSTYMAMPREGHLQQLYHMFGYLKIHPKRKIAFNFAHLQISKQMFKAYDWYDFYCNTSEAIPNDMLKPHGNLCQHTVLWMQATELIVQFEGHKSESSCSATRAQ